MNKPSPRSWLLLPFLIVACGSSSGSDAGGGLDDLGGAAGSSSSGAGAPTGTGGAGAGATGRAGAPSGGGASAGGGAPNGTGGRSAGGTSAGGAAGKSGGAGAPAGGAAGGGSTGGPYGPSASCKAWPAATGSPQKLSKTQSVSKDFDGKLQRFVSDGLGDGTQGEEQLPLFELADGATLENVIIGAPAADGIHCAGTCTLKNVWWEDVGEDAATLKGSSSSQVMTIDCGGAKSASDKVFQQNGPGTMKISNFYVSNFGKLYRSCGNCSKQYAKHVIISGISALGGKDLAGVNENYGDTATFTNIVAASNIVICQRYTGNDTGAEPPTTGSGPDGKVCIYKTSDIHAP